MVAIHPHALKHGLSEREVAYAWEHHTVSAVRVPGECEVRIGFAPDGREVQMVGALLVDGVWLVHHAMTPPTKRMRTEIDQRRRRRS